MTGALAPEGSFPQNSPVLRDRVRCFATEYCPYSHFQSANCCRNSTFLNFPTLVRGIASTNTIESGNCHFANVAAKYCRNSSTVAECPVFKTTAASGRSCHFGCGSPTTHASFTAGCPIKQFSRSTELIHSPPDFTKSFARSINRTYPSSSIVATSPVRNHPSAVHRRAWAGAL